MKRILFALPFRPLAVLHASASGKPGSATQNTLVIFAGGDVCKPEIERLAQTTAIKAGLMSAVANATCGTNARHRHAEADSVRCDGSRPASSHRSDCYLFQRRKR